LKISRKIIVLLIGVFYASPAANIAVNAQYAFGNTNVVVKVGILGFIISIILKLVMYYYFEITGLLIAISLHYLLNFSIHTIILLKRNEFNSQ
jgi:peptidoglycan biosynthesis protein MviN/MurJ (putative lipid II flippase)